jgi:signal transduction histidine kinase
MIELNPFAISGITIAITYLPLFAFILKKGGSKLTRIYSLHILAIAAWGLCAFFIGTADTPNRFLWSMKIGNAVALLIPVFFLHATRIMINKKSGIFVLFSYVQALFFILIIFCNQMYADFYVFQESFFFHRGSPYFVVSFVIWEFLIIKSHIEILYYYKKNLPKQIFFLIFGGIGFIGGTMNFLPGLGLNIYPYGNFLIPIHSFALTYAIFKHQLLDLNIAYKKGVAYSILFTIITLSYLVIVVVLEKLVQGSLRYESVNISIATAFIIGLIFIPLRNKIQEITDHLFFNLSHEQMMTENELLRQEVAQTEKLRTIATFASGIAHEIKNPLTAIKTFAEYLPKKIHDQDFINKFIPIVNKEVDRINELVHGLLEYAKPSPLQLKPTDIHKLINDTLDILNNQFITKKIAVIKEFDQSKTQNILIDSKQIKQAFLNIFINAIDALQHDGHIRITTEFLRNKLVIKTTDSGCGISKEDLPHIFDPFFTKKENGTGLGLSITHGIIKEHGGRIFAESEVGRGTTFRIELPIKDA